VVLMVRAHTSWFPTTSEVGNNHQAGIKIEVNSLQEVDQVE